MGKGTRAGLPSKVTQDVSPVCSMGTAFQLGPCRIVCLGDRVSMGGGSACSWREQEHGSMMGEEVEGEMGSHRGFLGLLKTLALTEGNGKP